MPQVPKQRGNTAATHPASTGASSKTASATACKLSPVAGDPSSFSVSAVAMPVSFLLAAPDGKTELADVQVQQSGSSTPVPDQPTSLSGKGFTLNLKNGNYVVTLTVGTLPSAAPVWIIEDCAGATKVDWIATPVNVSGEFVLKVS
jgi:hypothetical protein